MSILPTFPLPPSSPSKSPLTLKNVQALYGDNAIQVWRDLIGPTHVYKSQWINSESLRAKYGLSDTRNGFHGSDSEEAARRELGMIFEGWDLDWFLRHQESESS